MDDDINALELDSYDSDDDEWTRNFEALVHAREERTDTKRRRMESPRQQEEPSMQWTPNVPTSRVDHIANVYKEMGRAVSQDLKGSDKGFMNTSSWTKAVREMTCDEDFVQKLVNVRQILDRTVVEKAPAMCVCVTSVAPNGKGSAYAYLRDESGEIGGAICTEVFDHFPTVAEGSTLLLKRVPLFATPLGDVSFVLRPESIQKVSHSSAMHRLM